MLGNTSPLETVRLKSKITSGFSILLAREFILKIFAFIGQLILARLLEPSDFGYYVIIVFIVNFFALFSDVGLSYAIIQKKEEPSRNELHSIFTLKILLSVILILTIYCLAPFAKYIYPTFGESTVLMLRLLSLILILTALRAVPIAIMERKLNYSVISTIDICGVLSFYFAALLFAFFGFHIWSFIYATLIKECIDVIVVFGITRWKPSFNFHFQQLKKLLHFGFYIQGNGLLNFLYSSTIPLIAGPISGPNAVGILNWAYNLANGPDAAVTTNFGRVAFSGFSRMQNDKNLLVTSIEKSISIMSVFTLLIPILILGFGMEGTQFLYTQKWQAGVLALYWFSANSIISSILATYGQGILVLGKSKNIFFANLISNSLNLTLGYFMIVIFGYVGIAIMSVISAFLLLGFYIYIGYHLNITIRFIHILLPKYCIAVITLAVIFLLNILLFHSFSLFIVKIILSLSVYLLGMYLFSRNDIIAILVLLLSSVGLQNLSEQVKKFAKN